MSPPPGATYNTTPTTFRVTVPSPAPQRWLVTPLTLLWIAIAAYAFVVAPKRPDDPASDTLIVSAFAALIGIPLIASVLFNRLGRITIAYDGGAGLVREHIGPLGNNQRFAWDALASVREVELRGRFTRSKGIELDLSAARSHRRLYFGKGLPDQTRRFLLEVLEAEIRAGRHARPLGLDG